MSYRTVVKEIDYSGFTKPLVNENGAMVLIAPKGTKTPKFIQSEKDVLREYGSPSALYPDIFELIAYTRQAPCWTSCAVHTDALYGGIDVELSGVVTFGTGRDIDTFDFASYPLVSHAFFTTSPYADDLAGKVTYVSGSRFNLSLYKVKGTGYQSVSDYTYSLIREKDNFGASLYIFDVFDNDAYVIPKVNTNFVGTSYALSGVVVNFSGGTRGSTPDSADILAAWNNFQYANKYPIRTFIDTRGDSTFTINTLIQTYQPYAQGISAIPLGKTAAQAITYRQGLGLDTDDVGLYTNWQKIKDPYNNSFAWISGMGSVAKKYAAMSDVYDAASPAGIDENGHGGQLSDWEAIEVENDYTDSELQSLDDAQINPIIKDDTYGLEIMGDRTLQVSLSDTSYIGTRRVYKIIIEQIVKQVLRLQEFKVNDRIHRLMAKTKTDAILSPIATDGWIRMFKTVCDESNNTNAVLDQRKFIITVYVQITPNSQVVELQFTRLGQNITIEMLNA